MGQDLIHELSSRQDAKVINRSLDGDFGGAVRALQYKGISMVDYNVEKERRGCVHVDLSLSFALVLSETQLLSRNERFNALFMVACSNSGVRNALVRNSVGES